MGNVDYEWTGKAPDQGLPFPTPQSSPNAARDIRFLAERIYIDADDPNLPTFTNTGPPLHFYGRGRPDGSQYPKLASVPQGSEFTCTQPHTTGAGGNYGAERWVFNGARWWCYEGHCTIQWSVTHSGIFSMALTLLGDAHMYVRVFDSNSQNAHEWTPTVPTGFVTDEGANLSCYTYFGANLEGQLAGPVVMRHSGYGTPPVFVKWWPNPQSWVVGEKQLQVAPGHARLWPDENTSLNGWNLTASPRETEQRLLEMKIAAHEGHPDVVGDPGMTEYLESLKSELAELEGQSDA